MPINRVPYLTTREQVLTTADAADAAEANVIAAQNEVNRLTAELSAAEAALAAAQADFDATKSQYNTSCDNDAAAVTASKFSAAPTAVRRY